MLVLRCGLAGVVWYPDAGCSLHPNARSNKHKTVWVINSNELVGKCSTYEELHTEFRWGDIMEKDHFEDLGIDGRKILKFVFKKWDGETWNGFL